MALSKAQLPQTCTSQCGPSWQQNFHGFLTVCAFAGQGWLGVDDVEMISGRTIGGGQLNRVVLLQAKQICACDPQQ